MRDPADSLRGRTRRDVQAKALYALEVAASERPGPYTDAGAEHFARVARQLLRHTFGRHAAAAPSVLPAGNSTTACVDDPASATPLLGPT